MKNIPDFNDTEIWCIKTALKERYGKTVEVSLADAEIRLNPGERELLSCPVVCWSEMKANFVIFKLGDKKYRPQFYYRTYQQFGTGRDQYEDITECVVTVLQVQADHSLGEHNPEIFG